MTYQKHNLKSNTSIPQILVFVVDNFSYLSLLSTTFPIHACHFPLKIVVKSLQVTSLVVCVKWIVLILSVVQNPVAHDRWLDERVLCLNKLAEYFLPLEKY